MERTMSMTELNFDLNHSGASGEAPSESHDSSDVGCGDGTDKRLLRGGRKSCDLGQTTSMAHFLRACGLCKRRLVPGRDIYMYRGDGAYCSLECRQQQMNVDEKKEKFALMASSSNNVEAPSAAALPVSAAGGETVAAL